MGGMVAQLLCKRHPSLVSGLVLCSTARNVLGSPMEKLAALALPTAAAAIRWNPLLQPVSAEVLGMAMLGPVDDPATARWARAQLRRTTLAAAVSAIQAVCAFTSHSWIGQIDVPTAVVVTTRDRIVPASRQLKLAQAVPGASVHEVDADHAVCITAPQAGVGDDMDRLDGLAAHGEYQHAGKFPVGKAEQRGLTAGREGDQRLALSPVAQEVPGHLSAPMVTAGDRPASGPRSTSPHASGATRSAGLSRCRPGNCTRSFSPLDRTTNGLLSGKLLSSR